MRSSMVILGIGTDLVDIARVARVHEGFGERFIVRMLHPVEREIFMALPNGRKVRYLATRFAAKEAFSKVLGCGIGEKARLHEICVRNDLGGRPCVTLFGNAKKTLETLAIDACCNDTVLHLSLADDSGYVVAFAQAIGYS